ncbi:M48 family metalloprotease [Flavobacteriaceae bacterium M23B6Z8]
MIKDHIQVSASFRRQSQKAILSIVLFILAYFLLLVLAMGLTALCIYGGIKMIVELPSFFMLVLGVGVIGFGLIILFFLVKFVFKSNKVDYSMLTQIRREEQPRLFELIDEIVKKVGTDFPKKVYLSPEVNASVFYDSNFWSMILPVRKNLMIGMGLVNSITDVELKAILSHEFGHFSQKTMTVGSYVYNVNQIIYNMLYDNESYEKLLGNFAASSGIFSFVAYLASGVIRGIQFILQKLYTVVNLSYMGLSREMEFHADEIAAQITGYHPLKESLLRMGMAEYAYNSVIGFYEGRIHENLQSSNIYAEQRMVIDYLAKDSELPISNGLPSISYQELNKFNKSKLVIKDQWASHPGVDERIAHLEKVAEEKKEEGSHLAMSIFSNATALCEQLTTLLFSTVNYEGEIQKFSFKSFESAFIKDFEANSFSKIYNSYYDQGNPIYFDLGKTIEQTIPVHDLKALFSDEMTDLKFTELSLRADIETIKQISERVYDVKTFDYDGKKYKRKESFSLLKELRASLAGLEDELRENDKKIFVFFNSKAKGKGKSEELIKLYDEFFGFDREWEDKLKVFNELSSSLSFTATVTPFDEIVRNFGRIESLEKQLKQQIHDLLEHESYQHIISKSSKEIFEKYISKKWVYFSRDTYDENNLNVLFTTLNEYPIVMSLLYFNVKKKLLDFQVSLIE